MAKCTQPAALVQGLVQAAIRSSATKEAVSELAALTGLSMEGSKMRTKPSAASGTPMMARMWSRAVVQSRAVEKPMSNAESQDGPRGQQLEVGRFLAPPGVRQRVRQSTMLP